MGISRERMADVFAGRHRHSARRYGRELRLSRAGGTMFPEHCASGAGALPK